MAQRRIIRALAVAVAVGLVWTAGMATADAMPVSIVVEHEPPLHKPDSGPPETDDRDEGIELIECLLAEDETAATLDGDDVLSGDGEAAPAIIETIPLS